MSRKFNDTGVCIPDRHFMADTSGKLKKIIELVEDGSYFTINRPRQYGKTTIVYLLSEHLAKKDQYLFIEMSFEGIGDTVFEKEENFCTTFVGMLAEEMEHQNAIDLSKFFWYSTLASTERELL